MEQVPDEMVGPGHNRPDFLFEHGLQYGQDRHGAQFANDFNLTARMAFRSGRLEPPQPRPLRRYPGGSER